MWLSYAFLAAVLCSILFTLFHLERSVSRVLVTFGLSMVIYTIGYIPLFAMIEYWG